MLQILLISMTPLYVALLKSIPLFKLLNIFSILSRPRYISSALDALMSSDVMIKKIQGSLFLPLYNGCFSGMQLNIHFDHTLA